MRRYTFGVYFVALCLFACVWGRYTTKSPMTTSEKDESVDLQAIMDECNSSFPISKEYITSLNESGSFPDETDKKPKCFILCTMKNFDIIDDDGNIDEEQANYFLYDVRSAEITSIISNCVKERTETCLCEKAYAFAKCVMSEVIELYDGE